MEKGNPQLENGYTPIANELLEAIMSSGIGGSELKIVLAICRMTYGWSRKEAEISLSLFVKMTGIDKRHVYRAIGLLIANGLISRSEGTVYKYGKPVYKYVINKKRWCHIGTRTGAILSPVASANMAPIKTRKQSLNNKRVDKVDNLKKQRHELISKVKMN